MTTPLNAIRQLGVIHPGDTLLLSTEQNLTFEQVDRIKAAVRDEMPGVHVVVVAGLHVTVLSPNDGSGI
jgi:hypothetical protein